MIGRLIPLHCASEAFFPVPSNGVVTIGRRPTSTIVCNHIAVSATHCVVKSIGHGIAEFAVEDRSTNGTFVNDTKIGKAQQAHLGDGDILSLTKPSEEDPGSGALGARIQFRLEVKSVGQSEHLPKEVQLGPAKVAAIGSLSAESQVRTGSALNDKVHEVGTMPGCALSTAMTAESFAKDLLVTEQQSKARITGELLQVKRRLDEERSRSEGIDRELRKARTLLEEERARRNSAQEACEKLQVDVDHLRPDHCVLQDLQVKHSDLQARHDGMEVELGAQLQRAKSLENLQDRVREDLAHVQHSSSRAEAQLTEVQQRLNQSQQKFEELQKKHAEMRAVADSARQEADQLQRALGSEGSVREQFEDQVALLNADIERAEKGERSAREGSGAAMALRLELEGRISACQADAEAAREMVCQAQQQLDHQVEDARRYSAAALRFAETTRAYIDCWARGLIDGPQISIDDVTRPIVHREPLDMDAKNPEDKWNSAQRSETAWIDDQAADARLVQHQDHVDVREPPKAVVSEGPALKEDSPPAKPKQTHGVLTLMVGSQDSALPPVTSFPMPADDEGDLANCSQSPARSQGSGYILGSGYMKRSASTSILVAPGLQPGLKRMRPAGIC